MAVNLTRAFLALLVVDIALEWSGRAQGLAVILTVTLMVLGLILGIRYARQGIRKTIWRLRNRLIATYVFIAVVPIVLILALAGIGTYIVVGQVAAYLASSQLERRAADLRAPLHFIAEASPAGRLGLVRELAPFIRDRVPEFELMVTGDQTLAWPSTSVFAPPPPGWKDYTGYILIDGLYYCVAMEHSRTADAILLAPIDGKLLEQLVPGIGVLTLTQGSVDLSRRDAAGTLPPPWNRVLDFEVDWPTQISFPTWDRSGGNKTALLFVKTRPSAVLAAIFRNNFEQGQGVLILFVILAVLLLLVWLASLLIGTSLARTITGAVQGLYEGTTRIAKGDFAYRIPVKGKDQLAELGQSFNNMTAQIQGLVEVAKEKERLQSEVEIASEVQNQLFPQSAPVLRSIELIGICQPARTISGDYYDYLCLPDGSLAVAIGDVAGKGISAALLMASIQSTMRTQLAAGLQISVAAGHGHRSARFCTASVVAELNRQLYANTAPEKYATFFFGVYDETSRTLTYTNAGHLPPLLVRGNSVGRLEVTGTVIGLFPVADYQEQTVQIEDGDLLIAYTDGITEPENAYGEEFGVERLADVVMRHRTAPAGEAIKKVMEAVAHWSTAPELPDDMTVVLARGRA